MYVYQFLSHLCMTRCVHTLIIFTFKPPIVFWTFLKTSWYSELLAGSCFLLYGSHSSGGSQSCGKVRPSTTKMKMNFIHSDHVRWQYSRANMYTLDLRMPALEWQSHYSVNVCLCFGIIHCIKLWCSKFMNFIRVFDFMNFTGEESQFQQKYHH